MGLDGVRRRPYACLRPVDRGTRDGVGAGWVALHRGAVVLLVTLNPWTVAHAGRILSDLPYAAVSVADVASFHSHHYRPGNVVVATDKGAGRCDGDEC